MATREVHVVCDDLMYSLFHHTLDCLRLIAGAMVSGYCSSRCPRRRPINAGFVHLCAILRILCSLPEQQTELASEKYETRCSEASQTIEALKVIH